MSFTRITEQIYFRPWFISVTGFAAVDTVFQSHLEKLKSKPDFSQRLELDDLVNQRQEMTIDASGIATIHVLGVLGQRLTNLEKTCGNTDYGEISAEIDAAISRGARGIFFLLDSPGGSAIGARDVAEKIAALEIPTVGYTDAQCTSACYYLAAGMDLIISSSDALVGSIGTILPWIDKSVMWSLLGIEAQNITTTGADLKDSLFEPSLTDEQREFLQSLVDDLSMQFHDHVSRNRNLDPEVFRAGFYIGETALDLGLVDDIGSAEEAKEVLEAIINDDDV